ncbi:class F sortase [Actinomadura sp. NAK00032]|uniref:class F sortase n=1 Tax=Actinomadura sp. NAK00032 TaxID=2742128 RepID=UPI00158FEFC2|nr:class F sortase [Actinomadura sp. NAK00032]QKW39368.1 class F sortase [Actinomadura sp. NAK00032]
MERHGRRSRALAALAVGLTGLVAAAFLAVQNHTATAAPPMPAPSASATPGTAAPATTPALPRSAPIRLEIPSIDVRTPLMTLAKNADQTVETPPLGRAQEAGWYRLGPAPGSRGAAVLIGHVDTATGPAVFYRLGDLRPGDTARVLRADGRTAVFRIDSVERVGKDDFPTQRVYGDPGYAAIRLITCGGRFDRGSGHYVDNVIAYGHLLRSETTR